MNTVHDRIESMTIDISFGILEPDVPISAQVSHLGDSHFLNVIVAVDPKLRRNALQQLGSLLEGAVTRLKYELEQRDVDTAHHLNDNATET